MSNDPFYAQHKGETPTELLPGSNSVLPPTKYRSNPVNGSTDLNALPSGSYADPNEAKVYNKLAQLNASLNQATAPRSSEATSSVSNGGNGTSMSSADVDRLEQLMNMNRQGDGTDDPEMKQIDKVLEKIIAVQHPEQVKAQVKQTGESVKGKVFTVSLAKGEAVSLLRNRWADTSRSPTYPSNDFYTLESEITKEPSNAIEAAIHETQTVVNGSVIKLRLSTDIIIDGLHIPKDNFLFGIVSLTGERLTIKVTSIRYRSSLFPVELSAYDLDGITGLYIPGTITRNIARESADKAVQSVGINSLDPSLGIQAASAGIEAAKSLLTRKTKLVKVTIKAGYRLLLLDEKQQ